jgi:ferrous iron transport protein B
MGVDGVLEDTLLQAREAGCERVVLVGNPNVGKSALFGALTGTYATVSNFPGTTVELSSARARIGGRHAHVVDTPGVLSLLPASEDERVTRDLLLDAEPSAVVVVVGDANNLPRTLSLALQVAELERPFVVCLNMIDEVGDARPDMAALERSLGVPVCPTAAVSGTGVEALRESLPAARRSFASVTYAPAIEEALAELAPLFGARRPARALALMALAGDAACISRLLPGLSASDAARLHAVQRRAAEALGAPPGYSIGLARHAAAAALADGTLPAPTRRRGRAAARLEPLTRHPFWGYPLAAVALFAMYQFVGVFGAGTLVELVEERLFGRLLNPWATAFVERALPWAAARELLVGPYGIVTMALTYSIALVLPIVSTFFVALGVFEDSGYLPRLALMANRAFRAMGLNGKAVLPMVLGLGCDTMATLTTRVLETPKERLIVILLLALGVPCSAQLAVTLALLQPLGPLALGLWGGVVLAVIVAVGRLAARLLPGESGDFVLELPPLRLPRPGNILVKTLARIEWYLREAVPLFVLGTLVLFAADRLALLGTVERLAEPLLAGGLGLPKQTAEAFVVGFLRRDFGAAGLYRLADSGALSPAQILVAVVTMTLFIPCIANFLMIVRERGWHTASALAAFIFPLAFAVGAALHFLLRLLSPPLGS